MLKRAIRTLWLILDTTDRMWLPVERSWRLNERHYGALQGLDKAQTVAKHGEAQVKIWRRSYDVPPPAARAGRSAAPALRRPLRRRRPAAAAGLRVAQGHAGAGDALLGIAHRSGAARRRTVLVVAHGNSLRALVKMLDGMTESDIVEFNIPTGIPMLYELDGKLRPLGRRFLGDPAAIAAAQDAVRRQTEKR